jgi:hypothetical protein
MTFIARPPGICESCWSRRVDNWMTALAFYCGHTQNFVHRLPRDIEWRVKRKVSAKKAQGLIDGAIRAAKVKARALGYEWDQVDALMRGVAKLKQLGEEMRSSEEESRRE